MNTPRVPTGKSRRIAIAITIVAVTGLGLLMWWLLRGGKDEGVLQLYGNVDIREVELAFRQPGRLASMAFDEGDAVVAGKVMAELDPQPYVEKLAAAEAGFGAAKAGLDKLRSGNRAQEIAQARETVRQAQAGFAEAERNFRRQDTLLASGASSQRTLDAARASRDQAASRLASARSALS